MGGLTDRAKSNSLLNMYIPVLACPTQNIQNEAESRMIERNLLNTGPTAPLDTGFFYK